MLSKITDLSFLYKIVISHLFYNMRPSGVEANPAVLSCLCCLSLFLNSR